MWRSLGLRRNGTLSRRRGYSASDFGQVSPKVIARQVIPETGPSHAAVTAQLSCRLSRARQLLPAKNCCWGLEVLILGTT